MAHPTAPKGIVESSSKISFLLAFVFIISGMLIPLGCKLEAQNEENKKVKSPKESDSLYVKEFLLAKDVVEREPIDTVQTFDLQDDMGWCYAKIFNNGPLRDLDFKWYHNGELYYTFDARIGSSPNWRTYSSVTLREGSWRVELAGPDDRVLKEIRFHVAD